jgi:hypothetical protein
LLVLNLARNRVYTSCRIWYTTQFNTPPPPPSQPYIVCINCTFSLGRGGGYEVREKIEGQQYTSIVPS